MFSLPDHVSLQQHPTARDKAVSTRRLGAGTLIVSVEALTSLLLPNEKGRRCDYCHCLQERGLRRCTGCVSYWYCDVTCQTLHWRTHKKYCKNLGVFCASRTFNQLASHEQIDALFLTHLLAECAVRASENKGDTSVSIFMSLLPGPGGDTPPSCPLATSQRPSQSATELFSRCGNNNFSIHSHLTTIAHGAFPLASRLFNHACVPNAVPKYRLVRGKPVVMEVVAIRDIEPEEEICVPYVDPALLETRQQMFRFTYGFTCTCPSCIALKRRDISRPAPDNNELDALGRSLVEFVFPDPSPDVITLTSLPVDLESVPVNVLPVLREACLAHFCESFRTCSHEGPFEVALQVGLTVLAFYVVIYPPNYPQIGMHILEMAKTAWNAYVTMETGGGRFLGEARTYLRLSKSVWGVVGPEGDEDGPLAEIEVLERLLSEV